eukprot:252958-Amphidinium_carterae.1
MHEVLSVASTSMSSRLHAQITRASALLYARRHWNDIDTTQLCSAKVCKGGRHESNTPAAYHVTSGC